MERDPIFTVQEKIELMSDVRYIKQRVENLSCKKQEAKLNKLAIYLAVLAALTIGSSAVKYII